ncbi:hypothetical protein QBC46DRAFT_398660 [Diplogelasinospora grovesii]|uniref:Myb-like domain-containing protein n=1 Tax=Diplogelasinospora grovesii TaxID=303347 RepID=A0AAN6MX33_9PEZI|nr:hypothetical protein QBC46DRAFT_398660 [Diplogelasinospora grovesii]
MLKKKSGFKPKVAPPRRPAARTPSSQAPEQSPTVTPLSNTPAPTSSSQSQDPASELPSAPRDGAPNILTPAPTAETGATQLSQVHSETSAEDTRQENSATEQEATRPELQAAPEPDVAPPAQVTADRGPSRPQTTATSEPLNFVTESRREVIIEVSSTVVAEVVATVAAPNQTPESVLPATVQIETITASRRRSSARTASATPAPAPRVSFATPPDSQSTPAAPSIEAEQPAASEPQPIQEVTSATEGDTSTPLQPSVEPADQAEGAEPPRATRARKRKAATSNGATPAEGPQPKKRASREKAAAPTNGEVQDGTAREGDKPTARTTRSRKRKSTEIEDNTEGLDGNVQQPKKRPSRVPRRSVTPENAEEVKIDINQVKMADLAKDLHIGKKFSLHDELMERERQKRKKYHDRKKREKSGVPEEGDPTSPSSTPIPEQQTQTSSTNPTSKSTPEAEPEQRTGAATAGEQYQIIDGQIVIDSRSLQVDRHARALEEAGDMEVEEENEFTHYVTSATYLRRNLKPQQWTADETEKFYSALAMFGTDFETITRLFPGKQRKHVKLKFNREERLQPQRIADVLVGRKRVAMMDIEEYQRQTGQEYETTEAIYAEQKRAEEEFEQQQKAAEEEKAEEARKKREALFGNPNAEEAENGGKKKRGRGKKKQVVETGFW